MRNILPILCIGSILGAGSPVQANESGRCGNTPRDQWLPEATFKTKVGELGYEVRKVKEEDSYYEVRAALQRLAEFATGKICLPSHREA